MGSRNSSNIKRFLIESPLTIPAAKMLAEMHDERYGLIFHMATIAIKDVDFYSTYIRRVICRHETRYFFLKRKQIFNQAINISDSLTEFEYRSKLENFKDNEKYSIHKKRYAFITNTNLFELDVYDHLHKGLIILNVTENNPIRMPKLTHLFRIKKELKNEDFSTNWLINNQFGICRSAY